MSTFFRKEKTWISSAHRGFVTGDIVQNTLRAYLEAAKKGADMIETDARMTSDGILVVNHDETAIGIDKNRERVCLHVSEVTFDELRKINLNIDGEHFDYVPTLEETLSLAYFHGMCVNIDLKDGIRHATDVARLVVECGMRGRVVYATNGAGTAAIKAVLGIDPDARFIDTKGNFTKENLSEIADYQSKCYVYTSDFSDENISEIRKSGCMLATISLNAQNAPDAFRHHPDMAEYPHTSDFAEIDKGILQSAKESFARIS